MKTAIIITGELRTFAMCRSTMPFLDDLNVDIYVSTWDRSIVENELINLYSDTEVTSQNIQTILNRPASILVEPIGCFEEKKYNSKMIHRMLTGWQMVESSGIEYDYVLVIRPDLFFDHQHPTMFTIDSLIEAGDKQIGWYTEGQKLQDNIFFGEFGTIKKLFSRLKIKDWEDSAEGDWHTWWTEFINWLDIKRLGGHVPFTFCRPIVKEANFREVTQCYIDWRDISIVKQIKLGNRDGVVIAWGEEEVRKAEVKTFDQYKVANKKVAVLVCGMIRQIDITVPSWNKLRELDSDWYLSTWDKSCEGYSSEMFIPKISEDFLSVFKEHKINKYDESDSDFNSYMVRCGGNALRYMYLISRFKEQLSKYEKIIIIRPDTFCEISNLTRFKQECILSNNAVSNIVYENFIQDFMFIVPGLFFEKLEIAEEWANIDRAFNPHRKWPDFMDHIDLKYKSTDSFDASIVRPNSRGKFPHTVRSVYQDCLEWGRWHGAA